MTILSPVQRQRRGCTVFLLFILAVLVLVGVSAYALYSFYPRGNASSTSTPVGIGITIAPDGEQIGISDGTYAFDTNRSDGSLKIQAADALKKGDITGAQSLWNQAIAKDTNDAEALIYQENQRVRVSGDPYITLVVGTMLTGGASDISTGHDNLQGAYVAQKEYNDGFKLNGGVQVRLLIANSGSQADYATSVAQQVVQAAKLDRSIVGVMGWPFSSNALKAISVLSKAHIPMVSPTASSDALTGKSPFFFRVAPSNKSQAIAGAQYAEQQLHASRVALFYDPKDAYSNSLAQDFGQSLTPMGTK